MSKPSGVCDLCKHYQPWGYSCALGGQGKCIRQVNVLREFSQFEPKFSNDLLELILEDLREMGCGEEAEFLSIKYKEE